MSDTDLVNNVDGESSSSTPNTEIKPPLGMDVHVLYVYMNGWRDGGRDGWVGGGREGGMSGWMDGGRDGWMDSQVDGWMEGWMDG